MCDDSIVEYILYEDIIIADRLCEYEKCENIAKQIASKFITNIHIEILILKYLYKSSYKEIRKKIAKLISNREDDIIQFIRNCNDSDIIYLIGDGYKQLGKVTEAIKYFTKYLKSTSRPYYSDSTYPLDNIILFGIRCRDLSIIENFTSCIHKDDQEEIKTRALFTLISKHDLSSIDFMLSKFKNVSLVGSGNITALHVACGTNSLVLVKYFLKICPMLNRKDILDMTPIECAALRSIGEDAEVNIIKIIIEKYKDTSIECDDDILFSVDRLLARGTSWMQHSYRTYVKDILNKDIDWLNHKSQHI